MMGWAGFIAAFAAFFISHNLPLRPPIRSRLVRVLGGRGFTVVYSALSLIVIVWLIVAAGNAPFVALWFRAPWQGWVPLITMFAVCILIAFAIARPNPLSFGGAQNHRFNPARPGIIRWVHHPILAALALWALAHLVPNGDLAHVILFGVFALFALLGMWIVDRRKRREMGPAHWAALHHDIARGPLVVRPATWSGAAGRGALAIGLYAALLWAHPAAIGVSPLP